MSPVTETKTTAAGEPKAPEGMLALRLLSLALALLLWLAVILERPAETRLQVPLQPVHLPPGLVLSSATPPQVELVVAGPRIVLWGLPLRPLRCDIDLSGARAGTTDFSTQGALQLDGELKLVRIFPDTVRLTLAPAGQ